MKTTSNNQRPFNLRFKVCTECHKRYRLAYFPKHKCEVKTDDKSSGARRADSDRAAKTV
ncbi:hypothetical protein PAJ34TS1_13230 [Paenibacillus azoreducens]